MFRTFGTYCVKRSKSQSYVYNTNNGKLDILTYGNGHKCKYIYDELDRIKEIQYNTSSTSTSFTTAYTYEYDANGNVSKITDMLSSQVTVFWYDSKGKLRNYYVNKRSDENDQSALYFYYDNEGRPVKREYYRDYNASGVTNAIAETGIVYNDDGSVASIGTEVQGMIVSAEYSYDDLWRTSATVWKIGSYDANPPATITQSYTYSNYEYEYDGDEESEICDTPLIHSVTTSKPDGSETLYYTYDERGNIMLIRRGVNDIVCRYAYDSLGQLIREDNSVLGKTYVWTYDKAGNIRSRETYAYTTGNLDSVQNTVIYGYDTGSWGDLLISFNGQSIAYDGIGNPGTWNGSALTWQGRRLMSYGSNTYTYNADGIRTSKTVNGVEHIYHLSGTQILSEEWTEGSVQHILIYVYDASGQPIGMSHYENGEQRGTYVFVKNIQGDITGIYDDEGTCLVTYTYDAWGNVTVSYSNGGASTAAKYNPFRYRGYYYDNETSLYYLNSRYYDPNVGRFLNADGSVNANGDLIGFNMFAYCGNNPVMWRDPSGTYCVRLADDMTMSLINLSFALACIGTGYLAWTSATGKLSRSSTSFPIADIDVIDVVKPVWRSKNREVAIADEAEKVATDVSTAQHGKYYGAHALDKNSALIPLTSPMTLEEAIAWIDTVCIMRGYGDVSMDSTHIWGVYTVNQSDARILASAVGAAPYVDGPHSAAGYMHYHIKGKKLRGFKSFHVWFSMRGI